MSPGVKLWCRGMCGACAHPRGAHLRGMPILVGNPSLWDFCPRRMPFPRIPIVGICPPLWDVYSREKPISGHVLNVEFPSQWGAQASGRTGILIPEGCPFQREAHPREMPIPGGSPCQQSTCQPQSCTPPLPQPFSCCSQTPRMDVGLFVGPVAISVPSGPCPGNLSALPGPAFPPEPRGAVSPGRER